MKIVQVALVGFVFGGAALVGGLVAVGSTESHDDTVPNHFSDERLDIFESAPDPEDALPQGLDIPELPNLRDATVRFAGSAVGIEVFLAELSDGSVCVIANDPVGLGYTCGSMKDVAIGDLVLGGQMREGEPVFWEGVLPNGEFDVSIENVDVIQLDNVWLAVDKAAADTTDDRVVELSDGSSTVNVSLSNPAAETSVDG